MTARADAGEALHALPWSASPSRRAPTAPSRPRCLSSNRSATGAGAAGCVIAITVIAMRVC
jgi:hypothetical protein